MVNKHCAYLECAYLKKPGVIICDIKDISGNFSIYISVDLKAISVL